MENNNVKKYIKYGLLGSLIFSVFGLLAVVLSTKSIVCCNFINSLSCKEKEE